MIRYDFGQVLNRNGAGAGSTLLDGTFRPGVIVRTEGLGHIKIRVVTGIGGSTGTTYRLMDYTDASNPVQLQTTDNTDPETEAAAHTYTVAGTRTFFGDLGGVVDQVAVEVSATGVLTGSDTAAAYMTTMEMPL